MKYIKSIIVAEKVAEASFALNAVQSATINADLSLV